MKRRIFVMMFRKSAQVSMVIGLLLFFSLVITPSGALMAQEKSGETEIPATHIIDQDIVNQQNKQIGELEDLVIKRNGKIKRAVIDTGGFLGFGEKLIGISFKKLQIGKDGKIMLDMTQDQLEKLPAFDYYKYGLRRDYIYGRFSPSRLYHHPNEMVPPQRFRNPYYPAPYWQSYESENGELHEWAYYPPMFLASVVINRTLFNFQDETVGEVQDLLINDKGVISTIIIAMASLFEEEHYIALPYKPIGFTRYGLVYDATKKELEKAPAYHYKD